MHLPYSRASPWGPNDARGQGTTLPWPIHARGAAGFVAYSANALTPAVDQYQFVFFRLKIIDKQGERPNNGRLRYEDFDCCNRRGARYCGKRAGFGSEEPDHLWGAGWNL
jgi:hypothetical protein